MPSSLRSRRAPAVVVAALLLAALGSFALVGARASNPGSGVGAAAAASLQGPPTLEAPAVVRAEVGTETEGAVRASDAAGNPLAVESPELPPGAGLDPAGTLRWAPEEAGTWTLEVRATDEQGHQVSRDVLLEARFPAHPDLLVAMGDSVASGHGLQRRDYLGLDGCWRDEADAYPRRVLDGLVEAGRLDAERAELALVACTGAPTGSLSVEPVTGGPSALAEGELSQLEWAVRTNPGLVTVTVGANDLRFHQPAELIDGDSLDRDVLERRLDAMADGLRVLLERLVEATDAQVVVTSYHNPVADEPRGIDECREACFRRAADEVVADLNGAIAGVVASLDVERVVLADVAPAFVGHGAPRPTGGFAFREQALGMLSAVVAVPDTSTSAFCARGDGGGGGSWINGIDCIHPTGRGAQAYADTVLDVLG